MSAQNAVHVAARRLHRVAVGGSRDDSSAPLEPSADSLDLAAEHISHEALHDGPIQSVGLELEMHLVDLARPGRRPEWEQVRSVVDGLGPMPSGSSVTVEPGGQLELSTPPATGVVASVAALQADRRELARSLADAGYGGAPIGADPARPLAIINPAGRYAAMHQHFAAVGCAVPGRQMMTSTAALQVNLDAGPKAGWQDRLDLIHQLGPVFVAISACSPMLAGHAPGWRSTRQRAWTGIDPARTARFAAGDPARQWAAYALAAPVMMLHDHETAEAQPVTRRVSLGRWLTDQAGLSRRPALRDVDFHLTTLFPPVRPRGYLELRFLDAVPDRWWPALAAITTTLIDNPRAAERAAEVTNLGPDAWLRSAREGLSDPAVYQAAVGCLEAAVAHGPAELRDGVEAYAALVERGRTPGDDLRDDLRAADPITVLEDHARA